MNVGKNQDILSRLWSPHLQHPVSFTPDITSLSSLYNFSEYGYSVLQTEDQGFLVVGYTEKTIQLQTTIAVLIIKVTSQGNLLWNKTYTGLGYARGACVIETTDHNVVIAGATTSLNQTNTSSALLLNMNQNGEILWQRSYHVSPGCDASFVQQTADGGFILVGRTHSSDLNIYVIKTDGQGMKEWDASYDIGGEDIALSLQQTTDAGYIITGTSISFDNVSQPEEHLLLLKINTTGAEQWTRLFTIGDWCMGYSVLQTADQGFLVSGTTVQMNVSEYSSSVLLLKTDDSGNLVWQKTFGTMLSSGSRMQQTADQGYIITGVTYRSLDEWNSESNIVDVLLIKTDANGSEQWNSTTDLQAYDSGLDVKQTQDLGYIVTGYTTPFSSLIDYPLDPSVLLIKYDANGHTPWAKIFGWSLEDFAPPTLSLVAPTPGVYRWNTKMRPLLYRTVAYGDIGFQVNASDSISGVSRVEFYVDGKLKSIDQWAPYAWTWQRTSKTIQLVHRHTVKIIAYDRAGNTASASVTLWKFF